MSAAMSAGRRVLDYIRQLEKEIRLLKKQIAHLKAEQKD